MYSLLIHIEFLFWGKRKNLRCVQKSTLQNHTNGTKPHNQNRFNKYYYSSVIFETTQLYLLSYLFLELYILQQQQFYWEHREEG